MARELAEKCAVFGVFSKSHHAARLVWTGLWALQHRGQEATGISSSDGKEIRTHKGSGLVASVYSDKSLDTLHGHLAIGHNRYSTFGGIFGHFQPVTTEANILAVAHNGNLPIVKPLQEFLARTGKAALDHLNDSELIQQALEYYMIKGASIEEAVKKAYPLFTGAFALVILTKDKVVGVRDSFGIRPFSIGKLRDGGYAVSSETCGLDSINAEFVRDVTPGEMIILDIDGLHSLDIGADYNMPVKENLDIFEFVYFARPDSFMYGKSINEVRREMGRQLAREQRIQADLVVPVPNSAIPAALGYAEESGIRFDHGLLKNSYIHRTFITPDALREKDVKLKLIPMREILKGKRVIVIDDSIVRGTTSRKLVHLARSAGAKEVHLLSSSPPVKYPDFYGIATPTQEELIASQMSVEEITNFVGADSVRYLSFEGLIKAIGIPQEKFCTSCFTGEYPIDIGENRNKIKFGV